MKFIPTDMSPQTNTVSAFDATVTLNRAAEPQSSVTNAESERTVSSPTVTSRVNATLSGMTALLDHPSGRAAIAASYAFASAYNRSPQEILTHLLTLIAFESDFRPVAGVSGSSARGFLSITSPFRRFALHTAESYLGSDFGPMSKLGDRFDRERTFLIVFGMWIAYYRKINQVASFTANFGWLNRREAPIIDALRSVEPRIASSAIGGRQFLITVLHIFPGGLKRSRISDLPYASSRYIPDARYAMELFANNTMIKALSERTESIASIVRTNSSMFRHSTNQLQIGEPSSFRIGNRSTDSRRGDVEVSPGIVLVGGYSLNPRKANAAQGVAARPHYGVDIRAALRTPVLAVGDGKIESLYVKLSRKPGASSWGRAIVLRLPDGTGYRYAHLDSFLVKQGQEVRKGDAIGYTGKSGTVSPHLHFEYLPHKTYLHGPDPLTDPAARYRFVFKNY